jgi:hypothetical protein
MQFNDEMQFPPQKWISTGREQPRVAALQHERSGTPRFNAPLSINRDEQPLEMSQSRGGGLPMRN